MKFQVFDVGHGFCAQAVAQNNNVLLFDCGHKSYPENRPSVFLPNWGCTGIEWLFVTNFDEDHISDLPQLRQRLPISVLMSNKSISPEQLRSLKLKSGPITPAMESLLDILDTYTERVTAPPSIPGIEYATFFNRYKIDFDDTNNISLVVFLRIGNLSIVIPGDLEAPGWKTLLQGQDFRDRLSNVNVFIASHHGRESGYCPEVFKYCRPGVIVFSDGPIQYETQEMAAVYSQHAKGITMNGVIRKVISTRNDGPLTWNI